MSNVKPLTYKIHLEPDLEHFTFQGKVESQVESEEAVREIIFHILDLAVWRCRTLYQGEFRNCPFSVDPGKEELRIFLPEEMTGLITLSIDYVGEINNRMAGFYRSKYSSQGKEKYAAITQFEESDARRAFPCFDHPARKATFDLEMVIDDKLTAISNNPISEEKILENGKKLVRFQETPKMSTYLLFFGVGEFEFIEDPGDVLIRVATMPGMKERGRYALEFSRKSLLYSEEYYGIKYPLPKLDLIAVADFAAGAMENWGAITFRENLLLHDPETTSKAGEERICVVIAHEIAHQWFGNLVTPDDWKYLWLNESFATYFGYGAVHRYYPEWELWPQFLHGQTDIALERDALHQTFPIEIPGGEHVVINVSTAPIIYNKGGSILRQVEGYVGEENFKRGLRTYLRKNEYGCASSHHLWEAIEEVSSKPVSKMMENWIGQPGFPMVRVRREGDRLVLRQERFTYLPNTSAQEWLIPLSVRLFLEDGRSKVLETLLDTRHANIEIDPTTVAYKLNDGQRGFYRVEYEEAGHLEKLGKRIASKALGPEDRWGIQNDFYAFVKRGDRALDEYLRFLPCYADEDSFLPLTNIASNLHHAYLVMDANERVASAGRRILGNTLDHIGYEPAPSETHPTSIMRDQMIWHACLYGLNPVSEFALGRFGSMLKGEKVHPDIMRSVMQVGAFCGGEEALQWLLKRFKSSESEHERMNILVAIGCFRERRLIEKAQQIILEEVPDRNKFIPIGVLSENPSAMPFMWDWYLSNLERLEGFHPIHYERVISSIVPLCGLGREEEVKDFLKGYLKGKEKLAEVVNLCLEKLEINSRLRKSNRLQRV
jgi:tricorn protease interacting factor F2/3